MWKLLEYQILILFSKFGLKVYFVKMAKKKGTRTWNRTIISCFMSMKMLILTAFASLEHEQKTEEH